MRTQRQLRVGEEIRHALATVLMRGDIPWPKGFTPPPGVTVTEVQISPDLAKNDQQIDLAIKTALANRRVIDRVIVGNETQLTGSVSAGQLEAYLDRVRAALPARIKVTTAETWSTWVVIPDVAKHVDVVFVHLLPYWESVHISGASQHGSGSRRKLRRRLRKLIAVERGEDRRRVSK